MTDHFTLPFKGDKEAKLRQVKALAAEKGFEFVGNTRKGTFAGDTMLGRVAGNYSISGQTIAVEITERPMFLSVARIKREFASFLG